MVLTEVAKEELRHWEERDKFLSRLGRIAESCWLIMLRVYTAQNRGNCCIASATRGLHLGLATTLRYVGAMEELGYLRSSIDPHDQRRRYLCLTDDANRNMESILSGYMPGNIVPVRQARYIEASTRW